METILLAIALVNIAITKWVKEQLKKWNIELHGKWTVVASQLTAQAAAWAAYGFGLIPDAKWWGVAILGIISGLGSNLTYWGLKKEEKK